MIQVVAKGFFTACVLFGLACAGRHEASAQEVITIGRVLPGATNRSSRPNNYSEISHQLWTELLARHVNDDGAVDYASWHESQPDRDKLTDYLDHLSSLDLKSASSQSEELAFWINAYNALTIHAVLHHYPIKSIREIASEDGGFNVWDDYQLHVGGKAFSLNQIEHDILRKLGDPRIHFAIVCASKSCPALGREAYSPDQLERQLTRDAKRFFAQPKNFARNEQTVQTSAILKWFEQDFGGSKTETLRRIRPWLPQRDFKAEFHKDIQVDFLPYDWSLNQSKK